MESPPPNLMGNPNGACAGLDEAAIVARAWLDPAAFAPLYQHYLDPVYRYCYRRLGSREAAEDATSLVFERAFRSLPAFRGGSFRAWLFAIAHNAVTDAYRRHGAERFQEDWDVEDPAPPPEQMALLADERRLLATALALLPRDQRHVIELRLSGVSSVGAPPAIVNAGVDALSHLGVRHIDIPITPWKVHQILVEHGAAK